MIIRSTLAAAAVAVTATAAQAEQWICTQSDSVGFVFEETAYSEAAWRRTHFGPSGPFVISPAPDFLQGAWQFQITSIGEDEPFIYCEDREDRVACTTSDRRFTLQVDTLRFTYTYLMGYLDAQDLWSEAEIEANGGIFTPFLIIGECAPF